ncbi:MAG: hypothetical protein KDM63_05915, partial [Verrucomicrobiae bacterium]|nr:hypothetical protein [Verrucomicrobiae bacterium]
PALMMGFYLWAITENFEKAGGLSLIDEILRVVPESLMYIVGIGALIGMAIMWLMILLLPLFGDWRGRLWLLFLIQNLYAALQALVHPDFW